MSDGTTTQGGAPAGGTTQGGGQTAPPWYSGLDAEHQGHLQVRGWDKLDPAAAAIEMTKAHRQLRILNGLPEEQLLRLPKDANDSDGWKATWQKLGAPVDPNGYEFKEVQVGEATASLVDTLRSSAAGVNMPKPMAETVAKSVADWVNGQETAKQTELAAKVQEADAAIRKSWGTNYPAYEFTANQGQAALASRLGDQLAPQLDAAFAKLREEGFGELVAQMRFVLGKGLSEDRPGTGGAGGNSETHNLHTATARKAELMADQAWTARYIAGGTAERREMQALNRIIAGAE